MGKGLVKSAELTLNAKKLSTFFGNNYLKANGRVD